MTTHKMTMNIVEKLSVFTSRAGPRKTQLEVGREQRGFAIRTTGELHSPLPFPAPLVASEGAARGGSHLTAPLVPPALRSRWVQSFPCPGMKFKWQESCKVAPTGRGQLSFLLSVLSGGLVGTNLPAPHHLLVVPQALPAGLAPCWSVSPEPCML